MAYVVGAQQRINKANCGHGRAYTCARQCARNPLPVERLRTSAAFGLSLTKRVRRLVTSDVAERIPAFDHFPYQRSIGDPSLRVHKNWWADCPAVRIIFAKDIPGSIPRIKSTGRA
jgi:hypothetical protein